MSENRGPNWVDYGNLFANIIQIGQLSSTNAKLRYLADAQASREQQKDAEESSRQTVFEMRRSLERLIPYQDIAPAGVWVIASLINQILTQME